MNFQSIAFIAFLASPNVAPPPAPVANHRALVASVATYKPLAGFNHVVGKARFVGFFLSAPGLCDVTVFEAVADDESLAAPPLRVEYKIAAGGREEIDAGDGAALAIACTIDADAIKIAPQYGRPPAAARL